MTSRHLFRLAGLIHILASAAALAGGAASFCGPAQAIEIALASEVLETGGRQAVTVSGLGRGEELELVWIDPAGRVRRAWGLTANRRGRAAARFRTAGALAGRHRVVAWCEATSTASSGPQEKDLVRDEAEDKKRAQASFVVLPGEPPEYVAVLEVGDAGAAGVTPGFAALTRAGLEPPSETAGWLVRILEGGPSFLEIDGARLRALRTAYEKSRSDELLGRPVCLRDRAWIEQVRRWAGPRAAKVAHRRPWLWSLGRGVALAPGDGRLDFCRSPQCTRALAAYLRRRYGNIQKLNRVWRTGFAGLAGARAPTGAEALEALTETRGGEAKGGREGAASRDASAARLPGILASWSDHRRFLDATWAETLAGCRDLVLSFDRRAEVGLEGVRLPGVFTGYDPTVTLRVLDWIETRPRPLDVALARSFGKRGSRAMTEIGSASPALDLWRGFVNGHRGAIVRPTLGPHREGDPPSTGMQAVRRALRRLEGGLAALVGRSTWEPDPVAVLYSQDSVRVEWLVNRVLTEPGARNAGAALSAWARLLADLGVSAEFVASRDVAKKALRKSRARVLILPRAYVLSRAEFREIRRFVRAGGLVIADANAGLYDGIFTDALELHVGDLFSIERPRELVQRPAPAGEGALTFVAPDVPGAFIDGVGPEGLRVAEVGLRTLPGFAFAETAAGTPAVISSPAGRGRAVYLNLALEDYPAIRAGRGGANLRRLVRNALELAQVAPRLEVALTSPGVRGDAVWGCERHSWRLEETEVFTLWLDPVAARSIGGAGGGEALRAELVFDRPGYCYDALRGVLLGSSRRIPVRLQPGPAVFARMPYDVESISIRARERAGRRPRTRGVEIVYEAVVETTTGSAGTHVVWQYLLDPHGARVPGASRVIVAERGVAKGRIRTALNEPPGEYSLVLRDATTGVEGAIVVTREETELGRMFPVGAPAER